MRQPQRHCSSRCVGNTECNCYLGGCTSFGWWCVQESDALASNPLGVHGTRSALVRRKRDLTLPSFYTPCETAERSCRAQLPGQDREISRASSPASRIAGQRSHVRRALSQQAYWTLSAIASTLEP